MLRFNHPTVVVFLGSFVQSALGLEDDLRAWHRNTHGSLDGFRPPTELLLPRLERAFDHAETHILGRESRLQMEFQLLREDFRRILEYQQSFGPSHDQPH